MRRCVNADEMLKPLALYYIVVPHLPIAPLMLPTPLAPFPHVSETRFYVLFIMYFVISPSFAWSHDPDFELLDYIPRDCLPEPVCINNPLPV